MIAAKVVAYVASAISVGAIVFGLYNLVINDIADRTAVKTFRLFDQNILGKPFDMLGTTPAHGGLICVGPEENQTCVHGSTGDKVVADTNEKWNNYDHYAERKTP